MSDLPELSWGEEVSWDYGRLAWVVVERGSLVDLCCDCVEGVLKESF